MRELTNRELIAKYLGRVFGVLCKYTHDGGYTTRMQANPLAVLAELQIKAMRSNGTVKGSGDEMFVEDCLNRFELPDDSFKGLTADEYSILSANYSLWKEQNVTAKAIMEKLQAKGIMQQSIASATGLSVSTVQRWATEKMTPERESLRKLIKYYNEVT